MKEALEEAKNVIRQCKLPDCMDESARERVLKNLEKATYTYKVVSNEKSRICALTSRGPFWNTIYVTSKAFDNLGQCCKLSSTLAHEANHMGSIFSGNSGDEASYVLEAACFDCKY